MQPVEDPVGDLVMLQKGRSSSHANNGCEVDQDTNISGEVVEAGSPMHATQIELF